MHRAIIGAGIIAATAGSLFAAGAARAVVTTYTTQSSFDAAATVAHIETFEGLPDGPQILPVRNGITFATLPGAYDLYILSASGGTNPLPSSRTLSADNNEAFRIGLSGGVTFTAFGLNIYTNRFSPPTVSLYAADNSLISATTLTQGANTYGFFGAVSSVPIAYATYIADRGGTENTAIDNVQIGAASASIGAVPEPASWALLVTGFGVVGAAARRRRAMVVA